MRCFQQMCLVGISAVFLWPHRKERWFQKYAGRGEANAAFAPPRLVFRLPCGKDFALLSGCAFRRRERGRLWVRLNVGTAMELER